MGGTRRITDPVEIRRVMDAYMLEPEKQRAPFLPIIFSTETRPGGIEYVGYRPLSACEMNGERIYTLTSSDSKYCNGLNSVKLSGIKYIETLL